MNAEEYLTTDDLIERINQLPKVFAIRSDLYGIDIYADREEYRDDDKDCRWFMTVDPKAKSIAQPFGDNFEGWPEEWLDPEFWDITTEEASKVIFDLNDELRDKIADLINQYIATPVEERFPEKKYRLRWINDQGHYKNYLNLNSNGAWVFVDDEIDADIFTESELEQLKKDNPRFAPAIDAMKEDVKDDEAD